MGRREEERISGGMEMKKRTGRAGAGRDGRSKESERERGGKWKGREEDWKDEKRKIWTLLYMLECCLGWIAWVENNHRSS